MHQTLPYYDRAYLTSLFSGGNSIFFIETNASLRRFHPQLLCAFESAAEKNPNRLVYVIQGKDAVMAGTERCTKAPQKDLPPN